MRAGRPRPTGLMPVRGTDRVEKVAGRLLALLAILAGVVAVLVGLSTATAGAERARTESTTVTQVQATVLEDVPYVPGDTLPGDKPVPMRWTGPDGVTRTSDQWVVGPAKAGTTEPMWVDPKGNPVLRPLGHSDVVIAAVVSGLGVFVGSVLVLVCGRMCVRQWAGRRNAAEWARAWRVVEPEWSGRAH